MMEITKQVIGWEVVELKKQAFALWDAAAFPAVLGSVDIRL
ncbi:hypothetical protein [Endozoicomonas sp.]